MMARRSRAETAAQAVTGNQPNTPTRQATGREVKEMKMIASVKYDKATSEFSIRERDTVTGDMSMTFANSLNNNERIFCKTVPAFETKFAIVWA